MATRSPPPGELGEPHAREPGAPTSAAGLRKGRTPVVGAACALVAIALGILTAAQTAHGRGVSALIHIDRDEPMAALVSPSFPFAQDGAHYDGVYFYAIARDPLATGRPHQLIDRAAYRYGHPGYGWLVWAASGGGRPGAVPLALVIVGLLAFAVGTFAAAYLARDVGISPWWALAVALNPGLLFAVGTDCAEAVEVAFAILAILAWTRGRWLLAGATIAAGCLTKEPLLLLPVALAAHEGYRYVVTRQLPADMRARAGALLAGPVIYAGWALYARSVFGALPSSGSHELAFPLSGWRQTLHLAGQFIDSGDSQVGYLAVPLLIAFGALLVVGVVNAVRGRTPLSFFFIALAALIFSTNWLVLLFPKDLVRVAALPLVLLPFVVGQRATLGLRPEVRPQ
jgi:hypothetical protein